MTFFDQLGKTVSKVLSVGQKSVIKTKATPNQDKMRSTLVKLSKVYEPMIKFVGTRHPAFPLKGPAKAHPCAVNNIMPGSKDCVPVDQFLNSQIPFIVKPYHNPTGSIKNKTSHGKYMFVNRALEENEVNSIFDLPKRLQFKPIEESEIEAINGGGAI